MNSGVYIPLSGALVQEKRLEVLANNLANVNTAGFKKDRPAFENVLLESMEPVPNSQLLKMISYDPLSLSIYNINRTLPSFDGVRTDYSEGILKETGNPLDLALEGDGFFCIVTPQGVMYTRNGSFTLDSQGVLVTQEGLPVLGENSGEITITGGGDVTVSSDGTIKVDGIEVDRLRIVDFERPYPLEKMGNSMFHLTEPLEEEKEAIDAKVKQGFIEHSNVNVMREMAMMIELNRTYESYQKVIHTIYDTTIYKAVNEVGRLA